MISCYKWDQTVQISTKNTLIVRIGIQRFVLSLSLCQSLPLSLFFSLSLSLPHPISFISACLSHSPLLRTLSPSLFTCLSIFHSLSHLFPFALCLSNFNYSFYLSIYFSLFVPSISVFLLNFCPFPSIRYLEYSSLSYSLSLSLSLLLSLPLSHSFSLSVVLAIFFVLSLMITPFRSAGRGSLVEPCKNADNLASSSSREVLHHRQYNINILVDWKRHHRSDLMKNRGEKIECCCVLVWIYLSTSALSNHCKAVSSSPTRRIKKKEKREEERERGREREKERERQIETSRKRETRRKRGKE